MEQVRIARERAVIELQNRDKKLEISHDGTKWWDFGGNATARNGGHCKGRNGGLPGKELLSRRIYENICQYYCGRMHKTGGRMPSNL